MLLKTGTFPLCWLKANITPILKRFTASTRPSEYRPISITPILSKIFERLLAKRLSSYCNKFDSLPNSQFGFRKGLGTGDALLNLSHDLQFSLDRIVTIDFNSAFDLVNHNALIYINCNCLALVGTFLVFLNSFY